MYPGTIDSQQTAKSDRSRNKTLGNILEMSGDELPRENRSVVCEIHHNEGQGDSMWQKENTPSKKHASDLSTHECHSPKTHSTWSQG